MMMKCMYWTIILVIAFMLCAYSYEDDFEREIEALLDDMAYEDGYLEDGNSADLILKRLDSLAAADEFISANDDRPVIIGFFDLTTNKKDFDTFEQLAHNDDEHYRFGYISSKEVLEEKRYSGCTVLAFPVSKFANLKNEKRRVRYPLKYIPSLSSLEAFVYQNAVPLVGEMNPQNEQIYRNTGLPLVTVFASLYYGDTNKDRDLQYLLLQIRTVAVKFKKLTFNIADTKTYLTEMDIKYGFDVAFAEQPVSVGLRDGSIYYIMPQDDFSVEKLEKFVVDFLDGKLEGIEQYENNSDGHTKKKDSPQRNKKHKRSKSDADLDQDSQVIALTDQNAKALLNTRNVDIFVEFFAPWCVHCQQLKPELRSTANAFKNDDGVIIAAMDATAYTIPPGYKVEGYPTLYFLPANNKQRPVLYSGSRRAGDMVEFISQHRTTEAARGSGLFSALLREDKRESIDQQEL